MSFSPYQPVYDLCQNRIANVATRAEDAAAATAGVVVVEVMRNGLDARLLLVVTVRRLLVLLLLDGSIEGCLLLNCCYRLLGAFACYCCFSVVLHALTVYDNGGCTRIIRVEG